MVKKTKKKYIFTYSYLCTRVCTPASEELVSIMSSDRHDGNIRDEGTFDLTSMERGVLSCRPPSVA